MNAQGSTGDIPAPGNCRVGKHSPPRRGGVAAASKCREVAGEHFLCRHKGSRAGWILASRRSLISAEEKQLIPDDRSAKGSAKLHGSRLVGNRVSGDARVRLRRGNFRAWQHGSALKGF